jgi:hypothetical protein
MIFLHVGHGKTGSSFLQAALANSIDALAKQGIAYPIAPTEAARVRVGAISSGNLEPAPGHADWFLAQDFGSDHVLISGEAWFNRLRPSGFLDQLRARFPAAQICLVMYVRDPLDHAVSHYQQMVKRGGSTDDFDALLATYNMPAKVARFLGWIDEQPDVLIRVHNYSRHRDRLLASFENTLGVPSGILIPPAQVRVNRSLSRSETELQRLFNGQFGAQSARFIADPLCDHLSEVRSELPPATVKTLAAFVTRMDQMLAHHKINARFGPTERYHVPRAEEAAALFVQETEGRVYKFSASQLQVLVDSMCAEIKRRSI